MTVLKTDSKCRFYDDQENKDPRYGNQGLELLNLK